MSWTKGQIITDTFTEMGLAEYEFDMTPEEKQTALRRLDAMMAEWGSRGLRLSYPLSASSLVDESNIPDYAAEAVITNLAIRLAPSYGKTVSIDTKATARRCLTTLYTLNGRAPEMQLPKMPKGAGYKSIDSRFTSEPIDPLAVGDDSELDLQGVFSNVAND